MRNCWNITVETLERELNEKSFNTWIKPIQFQNHSANKIELKVPNKFYKDWLNDHYKETILSTLRKSTNQHDLSLEFVYTEDADPLKQNQNLLNLAGTPVNFDLPAPKLNGFGSGSDHLIQKYCFDSFVVGPSNQFAFAASKAVSNNPGTVYNPLFIYGGSGLGKTHLMIAISNIIGASDKKLRVLYRTSEKFTNEWINSIHKGKTEEFRLRYRDNCDVLLLDDIQFLAGKEQTQIEFFHTFNTLYSARKQIIVTSDKYPKEIPFLDDRIGVAKFVRQSGYESLQVAPAGPRFVLAHVLGEQSQPGGQDVRRGPRPRCRDRIYERI